jgi:Fe-S-cluster containining protein
MLGALPPAEMRASCHDCAMVLPQDKLGELQRISFAPEVRCCSFRPQLPNFAVGEIFANRGPASALALASVRQRIAEGDASPLGLRVDAAYQLIYRHASSAAFGRAQRLRCPHLDPSGPCAIWASRPAVCATWFCKHERGCLGSRLWASLHSTLAAAEQVASRWCLQELGFDVAARQAAADAMKQSTLDAFALDRRPNASLAPRLWGAWHGREEAFYVACAELIRGREWTALEQTSLELAEMAAETRAVAAEHGDLSLPTRLRAGVFQVLGAVEGRLWLRSGSEFDTVEVAPEVIGLLARANGRTAEEIVAEHERATGQRPSRVLLRMLLDYGILVAA